MSVSIAPPVLVAVAPNGARKTTRDHPAVPLTPHALADCAETCLAAGAAMIHLHVRDAAGRHSLDPEDYRAAIATIRARVGEDLIVQVTTEAAGRYRAEEQIACADALAPEAISLGVRELFGGSADPDVATAFLERLARRGTLVQYIVYDAADLARFVGLHEAGRVPQPKPQMLFVLGSYAEQRPGFPAEILGMLGGLPAAWPWSVCAFGPRELACTTAAALLGGHVRVGFENNMQLPSGEVAADNAVLVRRTVATLADLGLAPATCTEARQLLRS